MPDPFASMSFGVSPFQALLLAPLTTLEALASSPMLFWQLMSLPPCLTLWWFKEHAFPSNLNKREIKFVFHYRILTCWKHLHCKNHFPEIFSVSCMF